MLHKQNKRKENPLPPGRPTAAMSLSLEGGNLMEELMHSDGILSTFFSILWYKGAGKRVHQLTGVNIPDTVLYLYSKPLHWYFSSKSGEIRKKSRSRLNSKHIEEQFLKNGNSVSGIKASYLMSVPSESAGGAPNTQVKYTFGHELRKFLQEDKPNGVLQLFFDPKPEVAREGTATRNSLVQTTWSPGCFFIEKRVNKHRIDQHKVPIDVRAATFDDYQNTETVPLVSDSVAGQFQRVCQLIAEHIRTVFRFKLASLVLNFKIDRHDKIWLLWCSSIRIVSEETPGMALTATTCPPAHHKRDQSKEETWQTQSAIKARHKRQACSDIQRHNETQRCPLCTRFHSGADLCRVPLKAVLAALSGYDDGDAAIPPPVHLIFPTLTPAEYHELQGDPCWHETQIPVCCACVKSLVHCATKLSPSTGASRRLLLLQPHQAASGPLGALRLQRQPHGSSSQPPLPQGARGTGGSAALRGDGGGVQSATPSSLYTSGGCDEMRLSEASASCAASDAIAPPLQGANITMALPRVWRNSNPDCLAITDGGVGGCAAPSVLAPLLKASRALEFYTYDHRGTATRLGYAAPAADGEAEGDEGVPGGGKALTPEARRALLAPGHYCLRMSAGWIAQALADRGCAAGASSGGSCGDPFGVVGGGGGVGVSPPPPPPPTPSLRVLLGQAGCRPGLAV